MTEQYEEVTDYRKIGIIAGLIGMGVLSFFLISSGLVTTDSLQLKDYTEITEEELASQLQSEFLANNKDVIAKYVEFGLSEESITEILLADCTILDSLINLGKIYESLIERRKDYASRFVSHVSYFKCRDSR